MKSIWIFSITLNLFTYVFAGPVQVIYSGDGCECPSRLNYKVAVPQLPPPPKYMPNNYGYKIDAPPIQATAKVSYTFDFSVEEPKPPCPAVPEKLNLLAKVDRIALHKADCPNSYLPPPPPPPPSAPAPCSCGRCGITKPLYRYVNGKIVQPCRCRRPKCKCNLRCPNSINIENPVLLASDSKKSLRRKRDLQRIFFRPRRQEQLRSARFVKLYHKPISINKEKENDKENWLNMDFFSEANPFKRKTKKVFFPDFRSRIVKRDIKGEYDLLEKERQEADLTLPEIIQFMPETLQPDFKRGPCQFGCRNKFSSMSKNTEEITTTQAQSYEANSGDNIETTAPTTSTTIMPNDTNDDDDAHGNTNSFTKRNANGFLYQAAVPPLHYPYSASPRNDYAAQNPQRNPNNPQEVSAASLCEQRNMYAAMRRAAEQRSSTEHLRLLVRPSSTVPDPFRPDTTPLSYTGDLEVPQFNQQRIQDPLLGAPNYPVQHISSEVLDRIISDIVYRHPDFIEASSHYGGALVDPEPQQAEQTKDFIKKLIDGRLSLFFDVPDEEYTHYYPVPSYRAHVYNPYIMPAFY